MKAIRLGWAAADLVLEPLVGLLKDFQPKPAGTGAAKALPFRRRGAGSATRDLAKAIAPDAKQAAELERALDTGVKAIEAAFAKQGTKDDLVLSVGFLVDRMMAAAQGRDAGDKARDALTRQIGEAISASEVRRLPDARKQEIHDQSIALGFLLTMFLTEGEKDPAVRDVARSTGRLSISKVLGVDAESLAYDDAGLRRVAGATATTKPVFGDGPATIEAATPKGWTRSVVEGGFGLEKSISTRNKRGLPLVVRFNVIAGNAFDREPGKLLHELWDANLKQSVPEDEIVAGAKLRDLRPEIFRRTVGNGLRCWFCGVAWVRKDDPIDFLGTTQEMHLYLIESAGKWVPAVAVMTGFSGDPVAGGPALFGRDRHAWLEEAFAALRGRPSNQPLFTTAELAGEWNLTDTTMGATYVHAVTGAFLGTGFAARGQTIHLRGDGNYTASFAGVSGIGGVNQVLSEKQQGPWRIEADAHGAKLVRRRTDGTNSVNRVGGVATLKGGRRVLTLLPDNLLPTVPNLTTGTTPDRYFADR